MAGKFIFPTILKDETGATAVEYALLIGMMVLTTMLAMDGFAGEVDDLYQTVKTGLANQTAA